MNKFRYTIMLFKISIFTIFFAFGNSLNINAQIITTFAGNGSWAYGGDGGPATAAEFHFPIGLAVDSAGNVYICDWANSRVRKVNTAGIITTIAGTSTGGFSGDGGPATNAQIHAPWVVALDRLGNVYFSDAGNNRFRKIDTSGIITTFAGNGVAGNTGDGGPATAAAVSANGIAIDKTGNIYLCTGGAVRKVNTLGIITTVIGTGVPGFAGDGGPASSAQIGSKDVTMDPQGNIYLCDRDNYRIRKVDTSGIITTIAGNGTAGYSGDGGPATAAELSQLNNVSVDDAGNVYISDRDNNRLRKVNSLGIITTIAGDGMPGFIGDGGPATAAEFAFIFKAAKYGSGNIYVADEENCRVRMITDTNHAVHFTGAHLLHYNVCARFISIDSLLPATDADTGQVVRWSLIYGPFHGTANATFVTYTTGGPLMPTALTYTPAGGFIGFDTFKVRVSDGFTSDTTTIYVRVDTAMPYAATINGPDTVCIGHTITFTDTAAGGVWTTSNSHAIVASGIITGANTGIDTINYIVTNACGSDTARHKVVVRDCSAGTSPQPSPKERGLLLYPNPNYGSFTVNVTANINEDVRLIITNMLGEKVKELTIAANKSAEIKIDCPPGVYFLSAVTRDGWYREKVVVK